MDDDGFAYSAVSFPYDEISSNKEWCLKGAKGVQEEVEDGTSMILDTGCAKAMCSRYAYLLMREGLSEGQVELYCQTPAHLTSQTARKPWQERIAESGSLMSHLCSLTSPL